MAGADDEAEARTSSLWGSLALAATALPLCGALAFVVSQGGPAEAVASVQASVAAAGPLGPGVFALGYAASVVALLPAGPLTLAAGFLFGVPLGTAAVSVAATTGAAAAFVIARASRGYLRPALRRAAVGRRLDALGARVGPDGGFRAVLLVRLSPLFPFSASNYAFGALTDVQLGPFVAGTWLGALPGTLAFVYLGSTAEVASSAAAGAAASGDAPPAELALYALGALATLALARGAARMANEALSEAGGDEEGGPRRP